MAKQVDWGTAFHPLIKKYKGLKHPLNYENAYQLLVGIVLSAQDSDAHINKVTPHFFKEFPDMETLAAASPEAVMSKINHVRNFGQKTKRLVAIANALYVNKNIPMAMADLVELSGFGRKSANVFLREMGQKAEGVMVDLHVVRVAERLGITKSQDPKVIERDIMNAVPEKDWGDVGMAISFLGREICRPTNPKHSECVMRSVCQHYDEVGKKMIPGKPVKAKPAKKAPTIKKAASKKKVAKKTAPKKKARK